LNDAQERVSFQAGQFDDQLAALPGPVGQVGQAIQGFNESVNRFGKGLTAALGVIGLIAWYNKPKKNSDGFYNMYGKY
jgi:hypothetical protein